MGGGFAAHGVVRGLIRHALVDVAGTAEPTVELDALALLQRVRGLVRSEPEIRRAAERDLIAAGIGGGADICARRGGRTTDRRTRGDRRAEQPLDPLPMGELAPGTVDAARGSGMSIGAIERGLAAGLALNCRGLGRRPHQRRLARRWGVIWPAGRRLRVLRGLGQCTHEPPRYESSAAAMPAARTSRCVCYVAWWSEISAEFCGGDAVGGRSFARTAADPLPGAECVDSAPLRDAFVTRGR